MSFNNLCIVEKISIYCVKLNRFRTNRVIDLISRSYLLKYTTYVDDTRKENRIIYGMEKCCFKFETGYFRKCKLNVPRLFLVLLPGLENLSFEYLYCECRTA